MTSINPAVLAISGPIGSGKTTIATLLSQRLGWPHAAYGDLVRAIATAAACPRPQHLQHIGAELIADGWSAFTRRVLHHAWWPGSRSSWTACVARAPSPRCNGSPPPCPSSSSTWTSQPTPGSSAPASGTTFPPTLAQTKPTPWNRTRRSQARSRPPVLPLPTDRALT